MLFYIYIAAQSAIISFAVSFTIHSIYAKCRELKKLKEKETEPKEGEE